MEIGRNPSRRRDYAFSVSPEIAPFDSTTDKIITAENPCHSGYEFDPGIRFQDIPLRPSFESCSDHVCVAVLS
jgi:hypothetical protein